MKNLDVMVAIIADAIEDGTAPDSLHQIAEDLENEVYDTPEDYLDEDEELIEGVALTDLKVVKEKSGNGLSVTINGKEYRYVSDDLTAEELLKKVEGIAKH